MGDVPNPSAFPVNADNVGGPGANAPDPGMSLRDYFAGQALVALGTYPAHWDQRAADAYAIADAMLAARTKGNAA